MIFIAGCLLPPVVERKASSPAVSPITPARLKAVVKNSNVTQVLPFGRQLAPKKNHRPPKPVCRCALTATQIVAHLLRFVQDQS